MPKDLTGSSCQDYAAQFLKSLFQRPRCDWCQHVEQPLYRRGLCRHCYRISRQIVRSEAVRKQSHQVRGSIPTSHLLALDLSAKTARRMAVLAKSEGQAYGDIHVRSVGGLALERQFSRLSRCFVGRDLFDGDATLFDWSFTLNQKRLLDYLVSSLNREFARRHRQGIAAAQITHGSASRS